MIHERQAGHTQSIKNQKTKITASQGLGEGDREWETWEQRRHSKGACVIYSMTVNKREAEQENGNTVVKLFNVEVDVF